MNDGFSSLDRAVFAALFNVEAEAVRAARILNAAAIGDIDTIAIAMVQVVGMHGWLGWAAGCCLVLFVFSGNEGG